MMAMIMLINDDNYNLPSTKSMAKLMPPVPHTQ